MKINSVEIIEDDNKYEFEHRIKEEIRNRSVLDIKFAVTPKTHSSGFGGSYSSGEKYYAMIIFE